MNNINSARWKYELICVSFLLPALLIFGFVVVVPFFQGINIAFTNWNGMSQEMTYNGLNNFFNLFRDIQVRGALNNTLLYTVLTALGVNLFAMFIAVGLNEHVLGARFLKSAMFLPIITSLVIAAFIWLRVYGEVFPVNFRMASPLTSIPTVIPGIALVCLWRDTGLAMVIYNAGLQSIPAELREAAEIDGANTLQVFRRITFPMLAPAFTTAVTLWLGYGLKVFDYPYTLKGPGRSSQTIGVFVYDTFFSHNKAGYGQMAALVMLVIVVIITGMTTNLLRRREVEL